MNGWNNYRGSHKRKRQVEQAKLIQEIDCFPDELEVVTCSFSVLATTAPSRWMPSMLLIQRLEGSECLWVGESGFQDHVSLWIFK
jgi:hypothetical protein